MSEMSELFAEDLKTKDSISLLSYTNESILFEINEDSPECAIDNEVFDLLYNHVPQEIKNPCPKDMNYAQFRNGMVKVNEQMYKKIIKLGKVDEINLERTALSYEYSMFLEGQEDPFVSSVLSGEPGLINVREGQEPNAGIYLALDSMTMNEEALFWISFELMYGKLGCPPRIPPSSDILVTIKIIKSEDGENESSNGRNIFEKNRKEVHKMMLVAENHFNAREFHEAIKIFRKWIDKLEKTPLKDEEEENKQKQILIKMYQNVSLCYNKTNMPEKTCLMIRDLERLTSIKSNVKALYAKGFANMMLYNFRLARKCFEDAERIMPDLRNISATIRELDKLESQKNKFRKEQNRILMQMELEAQREMKKKTKKVEKERQQQKKLDEFETEIEELVIEFKNNQTIEKMTWTKDIELDSGWKIEVLEQLCQKHQLHLKGFKKIKSESTIYYMSKKSES